MRRLLPTLLILGCLAWAGSGCGGRSLGGGRDAGADARPPDAQVMPPLPGCEGQVLTPCPDACINVVGYFWDGAFCQPVICCCEGPDCTGIYNTLGGCVGAHSFCWSDTCTDTGGYCAPDTPPGGGCAEGHYPNPALEDNEPDLCGSGVCCTPCSEPLSTQVDYIGHSPEACAAIDWDCFSPGWESFQNDCGCGCYLVE